MGTTIEELNAAIEAEYDKIIAHCHSRFPLNDEASEVAHAAFAGAITFLQKNPDYQVDCCAAWVWAITKNTIINQYRYRRIRRNTILVDEMPEESYNTNLIDEIHRANLIDLVCNIANKRLTESQLTAITLYYKGEMVWEEVACIMFPEQEADAALIRAKSLCRRGKAAIRRTLQEPEYAALIAA